MTDKTGIAALVQHAARLSADLDLEVLDMGCLPGAPADSCACQLAGDHLLFNISLDGEWIIVAAQVMDLPDPPDRLLRIADSASGWDVAFRLVRSMVENEVKSLKRPIMCGATGLPDSFVIA